MAKVYGYPMNNNGTYNEKFMFEGTPENVASFIIKNWDKNNMITDLYDNQLVTTYGQFLNKVYSKEFRQELLKELLPMQAGEREPVELEVENMLEQNYYEIEL
jgi:hypothetical protein